jgi:hypothetical protein
MYGAEEMSTPWEKEEPIATDGMAFTGERPRDGCYSYVLLGKMLLMNFLRAFSPDADGSFSIASHGKRWVDG